jgi:hypothetical protein
MPSSQVTLALYAFVALPAMVISCGFTYVRRLDRYYEWYGSIPFVLVTAALTTQKLVEHSKGPVFALFVVIVPVFGISRFRFTTSVGVALVMVLGHLITLWAMQSAESSTDILFQGYNYFGGIVVAGICHYREGVLRRRNFVLLLPFCYEDFDALQIHRNLHDPRMRKQVLMDRWTLKFRNPFVEAAFYNSWYLLDSSPFEHPNCGKLHFRVYRTARFAVIAAISSQLTLAIQDWEYLRPRAAASNFFQTDAPINVYAVATALRFGFIIPAYLAIPLTMLFYGRKFYRRWRARAASVTRGGIMSPSCASGRWSSADECASPTSPTTRFLASVTPLSSGNGGGALEDDCEAPAKKRLMDIAYVRMVQRISTGILFVYSSCTGLILILADNRASTNNASAAPCYFLGFLNSILFLHRSSFRVRFGYAALGSVAATVITLAIAFAKYNPGFYTYAVYAMATNLLGMMVSHEEESLRRVFFTRMTLRSEEFRVRHEAISTIEPVLKQFVRRWRRNRAWTEPQDRCAKEISNKIPTVNQILQAGKTMAIAEAGKAVFAFIVELAS